MSQRSGTAAKRPRVSGASAAQAASRSAIPATFPTAQSFSVPAMEPLRSPRSRACTPLHVNTRSSSAAPGTRTGATCAASRIDAAATATRHRGETKPTRRTVRGAGRATARRRLANAVVLRPAERRRRRNLSGKPPGARAGGARCAPAPPRTRASPRRASGPRASSASRGGRTANDCRRPSTPRSIPGRGRPRRGCQRPSQTTTARGTQRRRRGLASSLQPKFLELP